MSDFAAALTRIHEHGDAILADATAMLRQLVGDTCVALSAAEGSILVPVEGKNELRFFVSINPVLESSGLSVPIDESVSGYVFTTRQAMAKINAKVGREIVVGGYGPPPGFMDDPAQIDAIIDTINESGASVVVVGIAAGMQERFIMRYRDRMPAAKLFLPLGGTIDYEAGAVKRPPAWITTIGMEWFWRLAREPKRRWRRYVLVQPPVLWHLLRQATGTYRNPF